MNVQKYKYYTDMLNNYRCLFFFPDDFSVHLFLFSKTIEL